MDTLCPRRTHLGKTFAVSLARCDTRAPGINSGFKSGPRKQLKMFGAGSQDSGLFCVSYENQLVVFPGSLARSATAMRMTSRIT